MKNTETIGALPDRRDGAHVAAQLGAAVGIFGLFLLAGFAFGLVAVLLGFGWRGLHDRPGAGPLCRRCGARADGQPWRD